MKAVFILAHDEARRRAVKAVQDAQPGMAVTISEPTRSLEANSAMWPMLHAFSEQLQWPVNGRMVYLSPEEWKDILSSAFRQETMRLAQGLNGGVVMLGLRTSKMSKREFSEFLDFIGSVAAERGVELEAAHA